MRRHVLLVSLALGLMWGMAGTGWAELGKAGDLDIVMVNCKAGECLLVELPSKAGNGQPDLLLIDGGEGSRGSKRQDGTYRRVPPPELGDVLDKFYASKGFLTKTKPLRFYAIVLTHFDWDHVGGLIGFLENAADRKYVVSGPNGPVTKPGHISCDRLLYNGVAQVTPEKGDPDVWTRIDGPHEGPPAEAIRSTIQPFFDAGLKVVSGGKKSVRVPAMGECVYSKSDCALSVFKCPIGEIEKRTPKWSERTNGSSLVMTLQWQPTSTKRFRALFTGDINEFAQEWFMETKPQIRDQVLAPSYLLKMPHHCSRHQFAGDPERHLKGFGKMVRPTVVFSSNGPSTFGTLWACTPYQRKKHQYFPTEAGLDTILQGIGSYLAPGILPKRGVYCVGDPALNPTAKHGNVVRVTPQSICLTVDSTGKPLAPWRINGTPRKVPK